MKADIKQETPSHGQCLKCGHQNRIEKFSPEIVPIEQSNTFNFTITEKGEGIELNTINMKCPICDSVFVDTLFITELN